MDEILSILRKHYVHWEKYKDRLQKFTTINELNKFWYQEIKEHGGYLSLEEVKKWADKPPIPKSHRVMPKIMGNDVFVLPTMVVNDPKFQRKYINIGNKLLIKHFQNKDHIMIDLTNNYGGKTEVMAAALSPILNILPDGPLTFLTKDDKKITDFEKVGLGCYKTKHYDVVCGSKNKLNGIKSIIVKVNANTCSAGEMIAIGMIAFSKHSKDINFKMEGELTCGATTSIRNFNLSDGGAMEVPVGYYTDVFGTVYKAGITPKSIQYAGMYYKYLSKYLELKYNK